MVLLLLSFLVIGAASAADFKLNDGFTTPSEYYSLNNETGIYLCTWDYNDEVVQESYLQNYTGYVIVAGDNNTYNTTYDSASDFQDILSVVARGTIILDYGVLEVTEFEGEKYIIYAYKDAGTPDDWKECYDELMKFNENNNITPLADAI